MRDTIGAVDQDAPTALRPRPATRTSRRGRGVPWFKYLTIAPLLIFSIGLVAYPVFELVKSSLGELSMVGTELNWKFVGLANFTEMLHDPIFPVTVRNSVIFIFFSVTISVVFGVFLAFVTDRMTKGRAFFQNVIIWPSLLAPVVISVIWLLILSPQLGVLNKLLHLVGLPDQTWLGEPAGAMASVVFVDVWHWTPIVYLLVYTALKGIDSSIMEAASVDGASYVRTVWSVLLPILTPAILGVVAIRVIMGVKVFDEMYLITFGGPGISTTIISLYIRSVFFDQLRFGYGSALSLVVIIAVLAVLCILLLVRSVIKRVSHG